MKKIFLFLILIIITVFLCSCVSPGPNVLPEENETESDNENEFVFALMPSQISLDPAHAYTALESQIYTAIYEGLVTYHPFTLQPLPGVAHDWEVSEDGTIYKFYLRETAAFSNGDPLTANDFKTSWLRMLDPDLKAEFSTFFDIIKGARDYRTGVESDTKLVGINVLSNYVLEVELESPAAHFLKLLCHMSFVPTHSHYQDESDWKERESIVGNGPFFIYKRNNDEIILLKNNLYWDKENVSLEKLIFRFYEEPVKISEDYNKTEVNWALNWDFETLDKQEDVLFNPMFATSYFFFKCSLPPWNDTRVRQALTLLIPWENIRNDQVFFPTSRLVPEIPDYPEVEIINETKIEEAFSLLEKAGFRDGKGLPDIVIRITPGGDSERMARIMAEAWEDKLGIKVSLDLQDFSIYFANLKKNDYTLGQMTWIGDFADPLTFLQMWTENSNLNDAGFVDVEYDNLIKKATAEEGIARYEIFSQAESIILKNAVVLPVSHRPTVNLLDLGYIDGWYPNPLDIHPFKYFSFKAGQVLPNIVMLDY